MFEQGRDALDPARRCARALAPEGDAVVYQGRAMHVAGWAKRFLFRSEQLDTAGGPPLRRRAGAHPDRPADAASRPTC